MANDSTNEDNWLYGDSQSESRESDNANNVENSLSANDTPQVDAEDTQEEAAEAFRASEELPPDVDSDAHAENTEEKENEVMYDKLDSDDSEDHVNVVIGDAKRSPSRSTISIKCGSLFPSTSSIDKLKQTGKFLIDDFESAGSINGVPLQEFNLDSLDEKPWRKPGADINDYFNYGFNEDTWRAYCEKQKRLRAQEAGLAPMNSAGLPCGLASITNDNSKYSGNFTGQRKTGRPPSKRMTGAIGVIGTNTGVASRRVIESSHLKENVFQVTSANRREYNRISDSLLGPSGTSLDFRDLCTPPLAYANYTQNFFNPESELYHGNYEPTQDSQWRTTTTEIHWAPRPGVDSYIDPPGVDSYINPSGVDSYTDPPEVLLPPGVSATDLEDINSQDEYYNCEESPQRETRRRTHGEKPERHRRRTHRRNKSRSRSRRHKSRSRSHRRFPRHRSPRRRSHSRRSHGKKKGKHRKQEKDESD